MNVFGCCCSDLWKLHFYRRVTLAWSCFTNSPVAITCLTSQGPWVTWRKKEKAVTRRSHFHTGSGAARDRALSSRTAATARGKPAAPWKAQQARPAAIDWAQRATPQVAKAKPSPDRLRWGHDDVLPARQRRRTWKRTGTATARGTDVQNPRKGEDDDEENETLRVCPQCDSTWRMSRQGNWASYLSIYPSIYLSLSLSLSVCLSIYLSICKLENEAILRDFFIFQSWQHQKRSNSARLPQSLNLTTSKTKQFCKTSSFFKVDNIKNEAILRDVLNISTWQRQKRSNSARLPHFSKLTTSKTKEFWKTSFKNGKLSAELTASCQCVLRFFQPMCLNYCAYHEKVMPGHTKSCTCHAKSFQQTRRSDAPKCNPSQEISARTS